MREELGLSPGDDVTIVVRGDEIVIRKASDFLASRLPPRGGPHDVAAEKRAYAEAVATDPVNRRPNAH